MSKHINADKLKAEIERYENTAIDAYNPLGEDADFWHGKVVACEDLKKLVTSIQQEQPEGGCSEKPNDLLSEQEPTCKDYTHFADVGKMEQPEVDLEKEIDRLWDSLYDELEGPHNKFEIYARCAHHFYELGLNARKGDSK